MLKMILHVFGRILVNVHVILVLGLAVTGNWILERTDYPDWQVGVAALGCLFLVVLIQRLILSRYVTGRWGTRLLKEFYRKDRANRYYDPWEQKRLFEG